MPDWLLNAAMPRDVDKILTIDRHAFKRSWKRASVLEELNRKGAFSYVARTRSDDSGTDIIAYVFVRILLKEMHILRIAVEGGHQVRGVATALLHRCFQLARQQQVNAVFIEVRPTNPSAIALYRKSGFQMLGARPNYYPETGEDALVMVKLLEVQA